MCWLLQPFPVREVRMQVPTNVPTPSPYQSQDPVPLGNLGEGAQVERARELQDTIMCTVCIMLPLSETQVICPNPHDNCLTLACFW
jgi:hypothetical protein